MVSACLICSISCPRSKGGFIRIRSNCPKLPLHARKSPCLTCTSGNDVARLDVKLWLTSTAVNSLLTISTARAMAQTILPVPALGSRTVCPCSIPAILTIRSARSGGVGKSCGADTTLTPSRNCSRMASKGVSSRGFVFLGFGFSVSKKKPVLSDDSTSVPAVRASSTAALLITPASLSKGIVRVKFAPPLPQLSKTVTETLFTFWM